MYNIFTRMKNLWETDLTLLRDWALPMKWKFFIFSVEKSFAYVGAVDTRSNFLKNH
jgi:hypothetical protein